jgi:hypothetical protein
VPGAPPPEFIANDETVKVTLTGATGTHYGNLATGDIPAGDDVRARRRHRRHAAPRASISTARPPLMFACKKTVGGTACPAAQGTIINIPEHRRHELHRPDGHGHAGSVLRQLTCAAFAETVSIPIQPARRPARRQPTKLRISSSRDGFSPVNGLGDSINVVAGHAIVAFQEL